MENIHVIAPFELTDNQMDLINANMKDRPYNVTFMETLFPWHENLKKIPDSANIIVSRGGLGEYLHKKANIPYIHIPVTPYDLLRAVSSVSDEGYQKIVVLIFDRIMKQEETFSLNFKDDSVHLLSYHHQDELDLLLGNLIEDDQVDVIIGDRRAIMAAEKHNISFHLLKSGHEALQMAVDQAIRTLEFKQQEQSKLHELELVLHSMQQAVIVVDKEDQIKTFNQRAKALFPKLDKKNKTKNYNKIIQNDELAVYINKRQELRNALVEINEQKVLVNTLITITNGQYSGAIQTFERLNDIQQLEMNIRKKLHKKGLIAKHNFTDIISADKYMKDTIKQAVNYAQSEATVLIEGETGTGKELFAQSIHNASQRQNKPFVAINCGSLSETLLESELFGYEEGSFTGAKRGGKAGLMELAHEGTLFLDEINEMSRAFQTKMLRVLQEQEVRRVGGERNIPVNVRIICASNIPLENLIEKNDFKQDFYYRISTLPLNIPPLRERKEDILHLALHFLTIEMERENRYLTWENDSVFSPLLGYPWLGNGRELQNIIKRFVITYPYQKVESQDLKNYLSRTVKRKEEILIPVSDSYKKMEKTMWKQLYNQFTGTKNEFCEKYDISATTLWRKISD